MNKNTPARKAMAYYFVNNHAVRKGNRVTIATALSNEYKIATGREIKNNIQYQAIVTEAQDRQSWKELAQHVTDKYICVTDNKIKRKRERRLASKQSCFV